MIINISSNKIFPGSFWCMQISCTKFTSESETLVLLVITIITSPGWRQASSLYIWAEFTVNVRLILPLNFIGNVTTEHNNYCLKWLVVSGLQQKLCQTQEASDRYMARVLTVCACAASLSLWSSLCSLSNLRICSWCRRNTLCILYRCSIIFSTNSKLKMAIDSVGPRLGPSTHIGNIFTRTGHHKSLLVIYKPVFTLSPPKMI